MEFLQGLASIVQGGGPILLLVALFIANRAVKRANDAVDALEKIRDAVTLLAPIVVESGKTLDYVKGRGDAAESLLTRQGILLQAVLSEVRKGAPR